jgi:C4-dicarboxylate-specific signal transduction histidine kinase
VTPPRRRPIHRAAAWSVLPFILIVIGAMSSWIQLRRARTEAVEQDALSLATDSAAVFEQYLRGLDSLASALTLNPSVMALNRAECDQLFAAVLRDQPLFLNILLSAPDETTKGSGLPTTNLKPQLSMPYIQQVVSTGRPAVSDLSVGALTHKPTVILGYPVRQGPGTVVGVLAVGLDLSRLQTTFSRIAMAPGAIVTLTNRRGLVLARSHQADRFIGTTIDVPNPAGPGEQPLVSRQVDVDGVERFVASADADSGPWLMAAGVPTTAVAAALWPIGQRTLAMLVLVLLGWVLLMLWSRRGFRQQLDRLREAAEQTARGELFSPAERSIDSELVPLHEAFTTLADTLRRTRSELEAQVEQEREVRDMLEMLQLHIVRQERLAAIGLLLAGVAHELNNPLQAIMGAAELLERRNDLLADVREEVVIIGIQTQRAAEIIRNLARFGAQRTALPVAINLGDVIAEVVRLRRTDLDASGITSEVNLASTGQVFASFTEIEQVLLNFVINAQQSIKAAGIVNGLIAIRSSDTDTLVRLEVTDNGSGVSPEDETKLFQPFFTTKPVGEGTGLGLSVSRRIIESYGGTVGYRRNDSGGAMFYFELPRLQ